MVSPAIQTMTIGMMQGRLSDCAPDATQCFPTKEWKEEFQAARRCGFNAIEWLVDSSEGNLLFTDSGRSQIQDISNSTSVRIPSVCADFFKSEALSGENSKRTEILGQITRAAGDLSIGVVVLPLCESTEVHNISDLSILRDRFLLPLEEKSRKAHVLFALETLADPQILTPFLENFRPGYVAVALDTGNAAAAGKDISHFIHSLGKYIGHVHIKDRQANGGPNVPLGEGNAKFKAAFQALKDIGYSGAYILETTRATNPAAQARRHYEFVTDILKKENLIS